MTRNEMQEPRARSNSFSAAWSYLWRGSKQQHPPHHHDQQAHHGNPTGRTTKHQTIKEEDDEEDRMLGKGITRKVLPQQRRSTSSAQSSPAGSSHTSPKTEPVRVLTAAQVQQPSALERIAIHNENINSALASTMQHSMALPPFDRTRGTENATLHGTPLGHSAESTRSQYHAQLRQQHQHQQQLAHQHQRQRYDLSSRHRAGHGRHLSVPEGIHNREGVTNTGASLSPMAAQLEGIPKVLASTDGCGSESADSTAYSTTTGAHQSPSPASCCSVSTASCPSPPSADKDNVSGPSTSPKPNAAFNPSRGFSSSSPPPTVGLGLSGVHTAQESADLLSQFVTPISGPSYFDITPSSSSSHQANHNHGLPSPSKKCSSSTFATKTPGRRTRRTPAHSISSTITNSNGGGSGFPSSRRVSCTDSASQNSASYLDEQDVDVDENSFYIHLQRMQERYQAQQEPGWLRTQHALLQAKHRIPGGGGGGGGGGSGGSSGSPQLDQKSSFGSKRSSLGMLPGSQQFLSRIQSSSSGSPNSSDYSSSPSFHLGSQQQSSLSRHQGSSGLHLSQQQHQQQHGQQHYQSQYQQAYQHGHGHGHGQQHRHQPILPLNCFQPGNVICVPRERTLGGLVFHKTFIDTHILTPSPYYRGQYLTLDHKVVEIDKDYVREISGFSHPRSVQILSEETVYNGSSKKPTRVLLLERPLVGDGVALTRTFDGPMVPNLRQFTSDMAFLESFPELSRALRDFNNLCQEFENTYVYIRGFAAYTLEKLRLVYEKAYRDCVGDSVKLQKMLDRGIQVEQECFAELVENVVLGKLYQKLFIHSLVPCYAQRDVEIDEIIVKYHRHLFIAGVHRGIDGGACLAATVDSVLLEETLQKLGLTEKWRSMRIDLALEGAAGLFRAWDQEDEEQQQHGLNSHGSSQRSAMVHQFQESEQERRRRQLRESLRIFVQDDKYRSSADKKRVGSVAPDDLTRMQDQEEEEDEDEEEEDDPTASALWNTPLEKAYCIKLVLDKIATVAEEHLMSGQGFGFVHKKRSEVSVTTDDFIPLLAIVIIHAQMMRLGSNLFYVQRFRINTPKSDLNFALVTFEASVEFLKTDPLGLLGSDHTPLPSTPNLGSVSRTPLQGSHPRIEIEHKTPSEELQILPWGTPSHTGWGFSPPNASEVHAYDQSTPGSEKNSHAATSSAETSPARPPLSSRFSGSGDSQQQYQQRHSRAASVNFDDRLRRVAASRSEEGGGGGSSNNSSWSRSPMMGPRFTSGTNSPLGATSPTYGVLPSTSEAGPGPVGRRPSHQLVQMSQRHSISSGQSHMSSQLHRISGEHSRSTLLPLQSPSMTPQLVVKPQIMLPPPKTPPMSGQITSTPGRGRPMSMAVVGALASSAYSSSYSGSGMTSNTTTRKSFSSNHSSPATSPRLGPGNMSGSRSGSRSNSLMSGPFPLLRTNSANTVLTASELSQSGRGHSSSPHQQQQPSPPKKAVDPADPMSPMSPISPWASRNVIQPPPPRPQSPSMMALSVSPSQIHGSPATEEPSMSLALPATSETLIAKSSPRTRSPTSSSLSIHATPANPPPGRIRTSPSSTISSISTPTTPSTFSSASGHALLDSLNASVQLVSSGGKSGGSLVSSSSASSDAESMIATSTAPSSNSGSMRSPSSGLSRHNSMRLSLPRLSIAPSAPSTAFCKTTVTAAATHATTSVDELEPTSTAVMATTMTDEADSYGAGLAAIAMIIPPTPTTPSTEPIVHGSSRTSGSGRNSFSEDMRSSSTAFGMGFGKRAQEKSASAHQKLDSGKYVGSTTQHSATSSTASSNTTDDSSSNVKGHHRHHGRHHHHGTSYSTNNISCSNAIIEHFSHGTALDFEPGFLVKDELCVDSNLTMPDRRRGSATSLRHGGGGCGSFQPEKEIVLWNQAPSMAGGTIVNGHGRAAAGGRLTVSSGDLPTSESTIPGSFVGADSAIMTGSGSFFSRSYTLTPMSTPGPLSLNTNSLMEENGGPLQRTRQKQQMMMGDFLSELAKVEDGDVLVGNGRDGVMSRQ